MKSTSDTEAVRPAEPPASVRRPLAPWWALLLAALALHGLLVGLDAALSSRPLFAAVVAAFVADLVARRLGARFELDGTPPLAAVGRGATVALGLALVALATATLLGARPTLGVPSLATGLAALRFVSLSVATETVLTVLPLAALGAARATPGLGLVAVSLAHVAPALGLPSVTPLGVVLSAALGAAAAALAMRFGAVSAIALSAAYPIATGSLLRGELFELDGFEGVLHPAHTARGVPAAALAIVAMVLAVGLASPPSSPRDA